MADAQMINVTVDRYDPEQNRSWEETYQVPYWRDMTALMALHEVRKDREIAYRHSCDGGVCTICMMNINGKNKLACKVILEEPTDLHFKPIPTQTVLRDLVTDLGGL